MKCDDFFYTDILVSLGLVIKNCSTSDNSIKFMVITKGTEKELNDITKYTQDTKNDLEKEKKDIDERETRVESLKTQGLIQKNILNRLIKKNKINDEFLKPYYTPKLNKLISNYLIFDKNSHLKDLIHNEDILIVFRGTTTNDNIITDLNIPIVSSEINNNIGGLHSGFVKGYNSIKDDLEKVLKTYIDKKNIIFTGHSLGGALASLATMDFTNKFKKYYKTHTIGLITFGSPRVTDEDASKEFTKLLLDKENPLQFNLRICNELDPIVYFKPPHFLTTTKYRHLISLIKYKGQNTQYTSIIFQLEKQPLVTKIFSFYHNRLFYPFPSRCHTKHQVST